MADDKKDEKKKTGKVKEEGNKPAAEKKPKAEKKEEKPKDEKKKGGKEEKKEDKKSATADVGEDGGKDYDPNEGAVKGTEIDPETGKPLDNKKANAASGGKAEDEGQKELHRKRDDVVPHPLGHEAEGAAPVVDGTTVAGGGVPGQPTEPTIPGQDQQIPSQPKSPLPLGGGGPVPTGGDVSDALSHGAHPVDVQGAPVHSPGESGPTGKLPIA